MSIVERKVPTATVDYWNARGLSTKVMMETRYRLQTDLFYLCQKAGYNDLDETIHGEICNFAVKKNPDLTFREFCAQDTTSHERLLMVSRGGLKSTIFTICDSVQFVLCWPNEMSILFITGTQKLGEDLIAEAKGHFERMDDGSPKQINGEDSMIQIAFPELCTNGEKLKTEYTCPNVQRVNIKEPTLSFGTVEANLSGPHYCVVKADDCVTNENSGKKERLESIRNHMSLHHKVRQPWGYFDNIGTPYDLSDNNGMILSNEDKNKTLFFDKGRVSSRNAGGRETLTHILVRPCMWRKDGNESLVDGNLDPNDWELWWPGRLNWKYLMGERGNLQTFATQYMLNPSLGRQIRFTRDRLTSAIRNFAQMPDVHGGLGLLVQNWDTAYKTGNWWNNYTVGVTALILGGKFHFVDMVRGQFNEHDLPRVMADFAFKWRPKRASIEDANGVRWLITRGVMPELKARGINDLWMEYIEVGNQKNSKEENVKPFAKALLEGRIVFSNGIREMDYLVEEFEKFPNGEFDDVVDAVATLVRHYSDVPEALVRMNDEELEQRRRMQMERIGYNHVYGIRPNGGIPLTSDSSSESVVDPWVAFDPFKGIL